MRKLIVIFALVLAACSTGSIKDFTTPDAAVAAYMEGIAARDFATILEATAVGEMSANFDFAAYIHWVASLTRFSLAPSSDPILVEINEAELVAEIGRQVKFFAYGLISTKGALLQDNVLVMEPGEGSAFVAELDLNRLAGIRLVKTGIPKPAMMASANYLTGAAQRAAIWSADETTERVVLFLFEGKTYMAGFSLMRYGERWKIYSQSSALGGTDSRGFPLAITPAAFEELLK